MKKLTALLVALLMLLALLAGCDNDFSERKETMEPNKGTSFIENPSEESNPTIPEETYPTETDPSLSTRKRYFAPTFAY